MYELQITLAGLPKLINAQSRAHWAMFYREAKKWKLIMERALLGRLPPTPLQYAHIHFTRFSCSPQGPDDDNLAASFKSVRDALTRYKVIIDDSPAHIVTQYSWEPAKRNDGRIKISVTELTPEEFTKRRNSY